MLDIATILGAIGVSDALTDCRQSPEYKARGNIFNSDSEEEPAAPEEVAEDSWMPSAVTDSNAFRKAQDLYAEIGARVSEAFDAIPVPVLDLTMPAERPMGKISKA
ncbi:hypothetical protein FOL47_006852 [Perkinsus chesapeaki]|uniref:Uncharacterized protein n=1 Tax=Perkinsus chesapeaki TaxID=330153 RepID=A0A7J6LP68_PERCH|nr:hypothetical protein FOL47_006852 [Perkinsus chesapeaki]